MERVGPLKMERVGPLKMERVGPLKMELIKLPEKAAQPPRTVKISTTPRQKLKMLHRTDCLNFVYSDTARMALRASFVFQKPVSSPQLISWSSHIWQVL
jgi:hypothetical protein